MCINAVEIHARRSGAGQSPTFTSLPCFLGQTPVRCYHSSFSGPASQQWWRRTSLQLSELKYSNDFFYLICICGVRGYFQVYAELPRINMWFYKTNCSHFLMHGVGTLERSWQRWVPWKQRKHFTLFRKHRSCFYLLFCSHISMYNYNLERNRGVQKRPEEHLLTLLL